MATVGVMSLLAVMTFLATCRKSYGWVFGPTIVTVSSSHRSSLATVGAMLLTTNLSLTYVIPGFVVMYAINLGILLYSV